jgi:predicted RND superfamily exporter protein
MHAFYQRFVRFLCRSAAVHPWRWVALTALISLPAFMAVRDLGIDTDLIRLLPRTSRASVLTQELEDVVSDGGYFVVMFESDDRERLLAAVADAEKKAAALEGIESVQYRWPVEFIEKYRYLGKKRRSRGGRKRTGRTWSSPWSATSTSTHTTRATTAASWGCSYGPSRA